MPEKFEGSGVPSQQSPELLKRSDVEEKISRIADSNKFWPIDWKHNRFLKILGVILFPIFLIDLLLTLLVIIAGINASTSPEAGMGGFIFGVIILMTGFVAIPLGLLFIPISLLRFRKLDKIDKVFLFISLLFTSGLVAMFLLVIFD